MLLLMFFFSDVFALYPVVVYILCLFHLWFCCACCFFLTMMELPYDDARAFCLFFFGVTLNCILFHCLFDDALTKSFSLLLHLVFAYPQINWWFFFNFISLVIRLDVYIYDYLLKRKLHASAKAFQTEGKVSTDPVGMIIKRELPKKTEFL